MQLKVVLNPRSLRTVGEVENSVPPSPPFPSQGIEVDFPNQIFPPVTLTLPIPGFPYKQKINSNYSEVTYSGIRQISAENHFSDSASNKDFRGRGSTMLIGRGRRLGKGVEAVKTTE